ncbi:oxidoreductase [Thalassobacillus devorans]|uniref:Oxidoreductase n=1 Tax=Thalassobacillus devorans TaxID=279813 RepID=A0ABQ1P392_9BACI|nr:NADPH:quinone oxidoreductase family protein [Thalassobacillus devorans]NIK28025.1 NADPH2:quinone reductase [Thalassobacillus devorans]GGC89494.1 oxidoreductase [Thalassobacillus devorans]
MRTWVVTELGDPEHALNIIESPVDSPGENEVQIKVEAFSLNFFDILQCQGKYQERPELPFTPGAEIAGTITETGRDVDLKVGDRVLATPLLPNGGFAEKINVHKENVFLVPDEMSFNEAAAMFITYQTAYYALKDRALLKAGETVLVHAGSGGVGSAAIQIAKAMEAKVIATAGSDEKTEICKQLGADVVINYREEDFVKVVKEHSDKGGADVIFDPVGGDVLHKSRKCIGFAGRLLLIGFAGGDIPEVPANHPLIKNYSIVGVHFGYFRKLFPELVVEAHQDLMELYQKGKIKPLIYHEYTFNEVINALEQLADRKTWGKLIVTP